MKIGISSTIVANNFNQEKIPTRDNYSCIWFPSFLEYAKLVGFSWRALHRDDRVQRTQTRIRTTKWIFFLSFFFIKGGNFNGKAVELLLTTKFRVQLWRIVFQNTSDKMWEACLQIVRTSCFDCHHLGSVASEHSFEEAGNCWTCYPFQTPDYKQLGYGAGGS